MSTYFSKIIKAGARQREFNFRQISNGTEATYSVDVPDDKGNRLMFSMHRNEDGTWKTDNGSLPVWIHDAEPALANAIEENKNEDLASGKRRR